jgi:hypothetical protein
MRGAKSLPLISCAGPPLSVLVQTGLVTGGGDSEYRSVAYSTSVHSAELNLHEMFLTMDRLVVLSALASLALFSAPNARNYQCHSTMRILPEMTISCRVRGHCAPYRQIQIQPRCDRLRMNLFQNQCLGCRIADVCDSTFSSSEVQLLQYGAAGLCCLFKLKRHIGSDTTKIIVLIGCTR